MIYITLPIGIIVLALNIYSVIETAIYVHTFNNKFEKLTYEEAKAECERKLKEMGV
jgi:hypothetical protein